MKIINKKNEKSLIDELIGNFKKDYLRKKKQNKKFSLVLTGGESPRRLYRKLAKINIDWNYVDLFWGDERFVSNKSKNSNFKLANDLFIKKVKIKKQDEISLKLEKNVDILDYVSNHNSLRPKLVVGFAAETNDLENYANKKLSEKNCDWIIANDVSNKSIGFESDFNEVSILYKNKKIERLKYKSKSEISDELVEKIINHLN